MPRQASATLAAPGERAAPAGRSSPAPGERARRREGARQRRERGRRRREETRRRRRVVPGDAPAVPGNARRSAAATSSVRRVGAVRRGGATDDGGNAAPGGQAPGAEGADRHEHVAEARRDAPARGRGVQGWMLRPGRRDSETAALRPGSRAKAAGRAESEARG